MKRKEELIELRRKLAMQIFAGVGDFEEFKRVTKKIGFKTINTNGKSETNKILEDLDLGSYFTEREVEENIQPSDLKEVEDALEEKLKENKEIRIMSGNWE